MSLTGIYTAHRFFDHTELIYAKSAPMGLRETSLQQDVVFEMTKQAKQRDVPVDQLKVITSQLSFDESGPTPVCRYQALVALLHAKYAHVDDLLVGSFFPLEFDTHAFDVIEYVPLSITSLTKEDMGPIIPIRRKWFQRVKYRVNTSEIIELWKCTHQ